MIALKLGDGVVGQVQGIEFVQLRAQESLFVFGQLLRPGGLFRLAQEGQPLTPACAIERQSLRQIGMQVEHRQLRLGAHQLLRFARAVEIDPEFAELLQLRQRGGAAIDGDAARLGRVDRTLQQQQTLIADRQVEFLQQRIEARVLADLELRLDDAFLGALAHHRLRRAVPGEQGKRPQQDGLTGAGLPGDDGEAGAQFQFGAIHQGEVADDEAANHRAGREP